MRELPNFETMYRAVMERDPAWEGIFFTAVKTTVIFCRPTCTARKPKKENVEFFPSSNDALQHGYRPCKICKPMLLKGETPPEIEKLLNEMSSDPGKRWKDQDLRDRALDPARIRRWFKKHHGITFHAYARALRIGCAFGQIRHGEKVAETAFESGYESLSGFTDSYKSITGSSPNNSLDQNIIKITRILTPIGPLMAGVIDEHLCLLEFSERRMMETQFKRVQKYFNAIILPGEDALFTELNRQIKAYFDGKLKQFDIPMKVPGTPFQEKVWECLQTIPYGKTRSYAEQAELIGNPNAVRAVAKANGDNRISILIPCHRVIGKDGSLTGYGGGLWRKKYLLELERENW